MARHYVGTSGWSYAHWRGLVYPRGVGQGDWLAHYATLLSSVELNASFYRLPTPSMLEGWRDKTPPGFVFALKGSRLISHLRRLADCAEDLERFLQATALLGKKRGPILFQLPPKFPADRMRLAAFLKLLPKSLRFAFEFRDPSWHSEETYALLGAHNAAFVPFELGKLKGPRVATADFVYVRLHGRKGRYRGNYTPEALNDWAHWLTAEMAQGRDAYVYFDNTDDADYAVRNAQTLDGLLARGATRKTRRPRR